MHLPENLFWYCLRGNAPNFQLMAHIQLSRPCLRLWATDGDKSDLFKILALISSPCGTWLRIPDIHGAKFQWTLLILNVSKIWMILFGAMYNLTIGIHLNSPLMWNILTIVTLRFPLLPGFLMQSLLRLCTLSDPLWGSGNESEIFDVMLDKSAYLKKLA